MSISKKISLHGGVVYLKEDKLYGTVLCVDYDSGVRSQHWGNDARMREIYTLVQEQQLDDLPPVNDPCASCTGCALKGGDQLSLPLEEVTVQ